MMTLKKLGEEVLRQYSRFNPNSDRKLHEQEVRLYCIQVLNQLLKVEYFNLHQKLGDAVPPHAIIATYEVDVVPANNPPKTLECTSALTEGFYQYWSDTGGLPWLTGDDQAWLSPGIPDVVVNFSYVSDYNFTVTITNLQWPDGIAPSTIATYLNNRTDNSFFTLVGATSLNKFLKSACGTFTVTSSSISFTYNYFDALKEASSYLRLQIEATAKALDGYIQDSQYVIEYIIPSLTAITNCKEAFRSDNIDAIINLPAQPISVQRGMGLWRIYDIANPNSPYIPLQSQQTALLYNISHTGLKDYLQYQTCYEWFGQNIVRFNKPTTKLPGRVGVQLLVVDPSQVDDMEPLPIPADMETQVITEVLKLIGVLPQPDLATDSNPNPR
jgi:hypothetical protein